MNTGFCKKHQGFFFTPSVIEPESQSWSLGYPVIHIIFVFVIYLSIYLSIYIRTFPYQIQNIKNQIQDVSNKIQEFKNQNQTFTNQIQNLLINS